MPGRTQAHVKSNTAGNKIVASESQDRQIGTPCWGSGESRAEFTCREGRGLNKLPQVKCLLEYPR